MSLQMRAAEAVVEWAGHVRLSERDSLLVLDLLEHPPAPNERMRASAREIPEPTQLTTTPRASTPPTPFPPASHFGSPRLKICASKLRLWAKLPILGGLGGAVH